MTETIDTNSGSVQTMSKTGSSGMIEVLKPAELAARLKVPVGTVKSSLWRSLERLQRCLGS